MSFIDFIRPKQKSNEDMAHDLQELRKKRIAEQGRANLVSAQAKEHRLLDKARSVTHPAHQSSGMGGKLKAASDFAGGWADDFKKQGSMFGNAGFGSSGPSMFDQMTQKPRRRK